LARPAQALDDQPGELVAIDLVRLTVGGHGGSPWARRTLYADGSAVARGTVHSRGPGPFLGCTAAPRPASITGKKPALTANGRGGRLAPVEPRWGAVGRGPRQ